MWSVGQRRNKIANIKYLGGQNACYLFSSIIDYKISSVTIQVVMYYKMFFVADLRIVCNIDLYNNIVCTLQV